MKFPDTWRFYAEADKPTGGVEEEEVKEEVKEEEQEEEKTTLEEDANALRNKEEDEINQKAIEEGDEQAKEDIADLLSLNEDEKKAGEEEEKEEKEEKVEDKSKEEEGKEEKKEEVKEEEKEEKKEEDEEDPLLAELGRLTAIATGAEVPPTTKPGEKKEEEKKEEVKPEEKKEQADDDLIDKITTPVSDDPQTYVTNEMFPENFDETDRKQLNTVLNQVVKKVREDTRRQTMQDAMKIFPGMMDYKMQGFMAAQEFWTNNPDLKSFCEKYPQVKQYVVFRSTEIQKQNPEAPLSEVYDKTEKEVRGLLKGRLEKMKAQAGSDEGGSIKNKPGLVRKPGASRKAPVPALKKDKTEKEQILELMNFDQ